MPENKNKEIKENYPLVSIIIPCWNEKRFLKDCLDSIYKQNYKNFEIIIVDSASTDGSPDFIKKNYPKVKLIELKKDQGCEHAINLGAREALGKYLLILSADIKFQDENLILKMVEAMKEDENCVLNPIQLDWEGNYVGAGGYEGIFTPFFYWLGKKIIKEPGESPFYPLLVCSFIPKKLFLENPLNELFFIYGEMEFGWRLHLKKIKIKVLFNTAFYHRCGGSLTYKSEKTSRAKSEKISRATARVLLFSSYVCFKLSTFFIFLPFILIRMIRDPFIKRYYHIKGYLLGILDFFRNIKSLTIWRKKIQKERKIKSDFEIFKIMIKSRYFAEKAKEKWLNIQKN